LPGLPKRGCDNDLRKRTGQSDTAHRDKIPDGKMSADSEHEQDDADLCQLRSKVRIGDEPRRERTDHNARQEISSQRRQAQPYCEQSTDKCKGQTDRYGRDQRNIMSGNYR
jgi:hypothetical protein